MLPTIAKIEKQAKYSLVDEWIKNGACIYVYIYISIGPLVSPKKKKRILPYIRHNMDLPRGHDAKKISQSVKCF